jgi:hypothetical protein
MSNRRYLCSSAPSIVRVAIATATLATGQKVLLKYSGTGNKIPLKKCRMLRPKDQRHLPGAWSSIPG